MSNKVVKGTVLLSSMVLLTKVIGFLFWVPFQNIADDGTITIYRLSFPYYNILLTIASAGVPITISKFVAERLANNNVIGARRVLITGSWILSLSGLISSAFMFFGAEFIAKVILDDQELVTVPSLKVLALAILVVPIMAVFRGYFQGHQEMMPTGLSQFVEQVIRVTVLIAVTYYMMHVNVSLGFTEAPDKSNIGYTKAEISAAATSGAFFGAIGGLLVVLWYNYRDKKRKRALLPNTLEERKRTLTRVEAKESYWSLAKSIIAYAIPISLATLVLPLLGAVDSATIPRILTDMGIGTKEVRDMFGVYYRADPLINVISVFSSSLTLVLIPTIAAHVKKNEMEEVENRIQQSWLNTLVISIPCSLALSILASPINIALYKDADGSLTMSILSFSAIFSTLALTSSGILQGLGYNNIPVRNLLIGAGVKVVGNFLLIPYLGLAGSAIAMIACYATVCTLNVSTVVRKTGVSFNWSHLVFKPVFSSIIFAGVLFVSYYTLDYLLIQDHHLSLGLLRILNLLICFVSGIVAALAYLITLLNTGTFHIEDLQTIPGGAKIVNLLGRLRVIRVN